MTERDGALWRRVDAAFDAGLDPLEDPEVVDALLADPAAARDFARLRDRLDLVARAPRAAVARRPRARVAAAMVAAALVVVAAWQGIAWRGIANRATGSASPAVPVLEVPLPRHAPEGRILFARFRSDSAARDGLLVERRAVAERFVVAVPSAAGPAGTARLRRTETRAVPRALP